MFFELPVNWKIPVKRKVSLTIFNIRKDLKPLKNLTTTKNPVTEEYPLNPFFYLIVLTEHHGLG